jgi:hypothetical protein
MSELAQIKLQLICKSSSGKMFEFRLKAPNTLTYKFVHLYGEKWVWQADGGSTVYRLESPIERFDNNLINLGAL